MRTLPDGMADALRGSAGDVSIQFNAWYNGRLIYPNMPVGSWNMGWDVSRAVQGQTTVTVEDPGGRLAPWGYDDGLGVGGARLQTMFVCGGRSLNLGLQRIVKSDPKEAWTLREKSGVKTWVPGTHQVQIEADDITTQIAADQFLTPQTPPGGTTVFSELRRVCQGICDVIIDSSLTDRTVPATVVYANDRMAVVAALADAIGAKLRVTGAGQLSVYKPPTASSWTVLGGSHDANLIDMQRSYLYQGLYNGVVSTNTLSNGVQIVGRAFITAGPLAWGGPHGHVPFFHSASFAQSQYDINVDATAQLAALQAGRAMSIPFTTTLNPAVEVGDVATLNMPMYDGSEYPLTGTITTVTLSGSGGVSATMSCTIDVPDAQIQAAAAYQKKMRYLG